MESKMFHTKMISHFASAFAASLEALRRSSLYGAVSRAEVFFHVKLHAVCFEVCVCLLVDRRITAAVCKQMLLSVGVVGADQAKMT